MKITHIQSSNFLGARAVDVKLNKPVALFAGANGAGKSSLQEAIRMALTGESVRVGLKKDYGALVTEGQESGFVSVATADSEYSVVLPSGKGIHSDNQMLPFALDAQRFARLSESDRRQFLFGLMGITFGAASVCERLIARGCNKDKVDKVAPFLRAGFDAAAKEAQGKARDAKAGWKAVTNGETWGKDKAAKWQPEPLPVDADKAGPRHENAVAKMKEFEQELGAAQQEFGAAKAKMQARQQVAEKRGALEEQAGKIERIQTKLNLDTAEMVAWEEKVEAARAKAGNPSLATRILVCPCCDARLVHRMADGALVEHQEPEHKADPEAAAKLPEYENALRLMQSTVANDKRDLAAAEQAAARLKELDDEAAETIDLAPLQARVEELTGKRDGWRADADKYRAVAEQANRRASVMLKASVLHQDVLDWTGIADALAPDGIPGELLAEALTPLNERMTDTSGIAEWADVTVTRDMEILAGGRPYALLSESEKWRTDAMIAEAVSHLSGVKLLVLDRFDVLDIKGREDLLYWLDGMAQDGDIDTALIFGTLKALPALNFTTIEAHWIDNGAAGQLKEAA